MGPPSHGQVLCGITKLSQRTQLTETSFKQLVQALQERYRYIFLATSGSGWTVDDPDIDQLALHLADRILLVVRPDVEGITLACRALRDWPQHQKVHVLLGEVGLPDQVSRRDVEAKLLWSWPSCRSTRGKWRRPGHATARSCASGAVGWLLLSSTWRVESWVAASSLRPMSRRGRVPGGSGCQ